MKCQSQIIIFGRSGCRTSLKLYSTISALTNQLITNSKSPGGKIFRDWPEEEKRRKQGNVTVKAHWRQRLTEYLQVVWSEDDLDL